MEVAKGIHRLTRGIANFYLIDEGGKLVLIDAGTPKDWDLLGRTLTARRRQLSDLDAVLLTHAHGDHTGFAEQARTAANARVWVHHADAAVATGASPARTMGRRPRTCSSLSSGERPSRCSAGREGSSPSPRCPPTATARRSMSRAVPGWCSLRGTPPGAPRCSWRSRGSCCPAMCW
jgi:hypothetical protein